MSYIGRSLAATFLLYPLVVAAGDFSVSPIRVDLTPANKAGSVAIHNDGAALPVRIKLMRWTQDANGIDQYAPTNDLIYFPRELIVEPGAVRTIRVLAPTAPTEPERAYRLFIEEQQTPEESTGKSARLAVLIKFGVAVYAYAKPVQPTVAFDFISAEAGKASLRLLNPSTTHTFIKEITAADVTFPDFKPRYVLGGAGFPLNALLNPAACAKGTVNVSVTTAEGALGATLVMPPSACK